MPDFCSLCATNGHRQLLSLRLYACRFLRPCYAKLIAKQNRYNYNFVGNLFDLIARIGQDQQTLGIPIGPDCSLVIAEIILSAVDAAFLKTRRVNGFRYLDDYEFGFNMYSEGFQVLADLQGELGAYELHLNPRKSSLSELPRSIEHPSVTELRGFRIGRRKPRLNTYLIRYFSRAYELSRIYPDDSVLRYALGRMRRNAVDQTNWPLYESTLLHIMVVGPGALSTVLDELYRYYQAGYQVNIRKVGDALQLVIREHGSVNHGSEVAWAIWRCLLCGIRLDDQTATQADGMEDSIVAILALYARSNGLISSNVNLSLWASMMTTQSLYEENWLLSYDANVKSWLPSTGVRDHVAVDRKFGVLKQNDVYFYDVNLPSDYRPAGVSINVGSSDEEQPEIEPTEEASGYASRWSCHVWNWVC